MSRLLVLLGVLALAAPAARAQFGIGGLVGDPTGVTVKIGRSGGVAVDVGLSNDLFVQAHYIVRESRIAGTSADVRFLFGPGGFLRNSDDAIAGVSALFGLSWYVAPEFEAFGQLTPGIRLTQIEDIVQVGAAVGLRFYP